MGGGGRARGEHVCLRGGKAKLGRAGNTVLRIRKWKVASFSLLTHTEPTQPLSLSPGNLLLPSVDPGF